MNAKNNGQNNGMQKVLQPNGSALNAGGTPGNKGGTGRPASAIRERCKGSFEARINVLEELADDKSISPRDRLAAVDKLGTYGIGTKQETTVVTVTKEGQDVLNKSFEVLVQMGFTSEQIDEYAKLMEAEQGE